MTMTVRIVVLAVLITQLRNIRVKVSFSQKQFANKLSGNWQLSECIDFADIKNMQNISRIKSMKLAIRFIFCNIPAKIIMSNNSWIYKHNLLVNSMII